MVVRAAVAAFEFAGGGGAAAVEEAAGEPAEVGFAFEVVHAVAFGDGQRRVETERQHVGVRRAELGAVAVLVLLGDDRPQLAVVPIDVAAPRSFPAALETHRLAIETRGVVPVAAER